MRKFSVRLLSVMMLSGIVGCVGVKPYEKEYLLNPIMDDEGLQSLNSDFRGSVISPFERLSSSGTGGAAGTSCPTCGG